MLWDLKTFIDEYKKELNIEYKTDNEVKEDIIKKIQTSFLECRGVLSLCNTYKNELIWSHYTNERGYCIELATKTLKKELSKNRNDNDYQFFPISYEKLKQIDFLDKVIKQTDKRTKEVEVLAMLSILYCFSQKDKCWEYEKEWRFLLRDKSFNHISFPTEIISDYKKTTKLKKTRW